MISTSYVTWAGTAVVTANEAALWTDGRYWLQAETEMDENWTLMRSFMPDTPSEGEWLNKVRVNVVKKIKVTSLETHVVSNHRQLDRLFNNLVWQGRKA